MEKRTGFRFATVVDLIRGNHAYPEPFQCASAATRPGKGAETVLTAAVAGLGNAGSRFDEEPRPMVYSHAGAYLAAADRYRLVGGADVEEGNRARFARRCPDTRVFADAAEMAAALRPDVISVCTPARGRAALVERILSAHRPRALIAEKPLELEAAERRRLLAACADARVPLVVNYNRRYASVYRAAQRTIAEGRLGAVQSITVLAPNRLWSIGSHAINLLCFMAGSGPERWRALGLPSLEEDGEPAGDLLCRFPSGAAGRVLTAGRRELLVFELDVIGVAGRLRVDQGERRLTVAHFADSRHFPTYRRLAEPECVHLAPEAESTFEALVREAADVAGNGATPTSGGDEAALSETVLEAVIKACNERST